MTTTKSERPSSEVLGKIAALAIMGGSEMSRIGSEQAQIPPAVWERLVRLNGMLQRIHSLASKAKVREAERDDD